MFLKILQYLRENTCVGVFFLNKVAGLKAWKPFLLKKQTLTQVFSCEYCEIFKNIILYRISPVVASDALHAIALITSLMLNYKFSLTRLYCVRTIVWVWYWRWFTLTHFSPMPHFYTPWKRQKTIGFLAFSGGIEMWHWIKMG